MGRDDSVTGELDLTFLIKQEGGEWVGMCPELNIVASGDSEDEVVEVLRDLVELYIAGCTDLGDVPVPLRPVPRETLLDFLAPPPGVADGRITSHRESVPLHAAA